jgi:hypothetical protein
MKEALTELPQRLTRRLKYYAWQVVVIQSDKTEAILGFHWPWGCHHLVLHRQQASFPVKFCVSYLCSPCECDQQTFKLELQRAWEKYLG